MGSLRVIWLLRRLLFLDEIVIRIHIFFCLLVLVRLLPRFSYLLLSLPRPSSVGARLSHVQFFSVMVATINGLLLNFSTVANIINGISLNCLLCLVKDNGDSGSDDGHVHG